VKGRVSIFDYLLFSIILQGEVLMIFININIPKTVDMITIVEVSTDTSKKTIECKKNKYRQKL